MGKRILLLFIIFLQICFAKNISFSQTTTYDNQLIKVAISANDLKTIKYKEIGISSTSQWQIYDEDTKQIVSFAKPNQNYKIVLNAGMFDIYENNNLVCDMLSGPLKITTDANGYIKIQDLERRGQEALYRGYFKIERVKSKIDEFYLINVIKLQDYLYSVVPNEMPVSFGLEALKAQAVAARNYALRPRTSSVNAQYDVTDSVDSQVYFGKNTEHHISTKAVNETESIIATNDGQIILALYHSTSGGITENYENAFNRPGTKIFPANPLPYLKAVSDIAGISSLEKDEDAANFYKTSPKTFENASPYFRWTKTWEKDELSQILNETLKQMSNCGFIAKMMPYSDELGTLKEVKVLQRGKSGKIVKMSIIGDKNVFMVEKELVIRKLFLKDGKMLPSANVVFENEYDEDGNLTTIKAYGGGYGHGVGMSQFGAGYLAKIGKSFEYILHHYYKDIKLSTIPITLDTNQQSEFKQNFYTDNKNAYLKVENAKNTDNLSIKINDSDMGSLKIPTPAPKTITYSLEPYMLDGLNSITYKISTPSTFKNTVKFYIEFVPAKSEEEDK